MNIFVCIVVWFFFPLIIYTQEMTKPIIRISYGCMTFSENKDLLGFYKKRHPALRAVRGARHQPGVPSAPVKSFHRQERVLLRPAEDHLTPSTTTRCRS